MIPKALLNTVIVDQSKELGSVREYVGRNMLPLAISYSGSSALVVKGVRRCGKSTLLKQLINTKFTGDFIYFNFDDERISNFKAEDFQTLMEALIGVFGDKKNVFFDEIQNVEGWELFVNRLLRQGYRVFITGSNANLLSRELGTHMTGRHVDIELYPFSFLEFIRARGIDIPKNGLYSTEQRARLSSEFEEYMEKGGMPEVVVYSNEAVLTQLVNDIIQKDILSRYNVRKPNELKAVIKFLIANASNEITYRSIAKNFAVRSPDTVEKYVSYASEAYLTFEIRRFEKKLRKIDKNPRKIYCVDTGIITKNTPNFFEKKGAILENIAAVQMKRLGHEFYYYRNTNGHEVDFVIPSKKEAIQVCYEFNNENRSRELRGMESAKRCSNASKFTILTIDQELDIKHENMNVKIMPMWRWLLESEPAA